MDRAAFVLLCALSPTLTTPGFAQSSCRAGHVLRQGRCVALSQAVRTQPKLSVTAPAALPQDDHLYQGQRGDHDIRRGVLSTAPTPRSCHPNC